MKRFFFLSVLLIFITKLSAQTWSPDGATWYYSFNQLFSLGYVKIVYTSDTTVLGKNCKILQKTQFGYSYPGVYDTLNLGKEYTYLDTNSNIVYRYFNNTFDTLYNFNAQIGDMWKVHGIQWVNDSGIVVVDSIGQKIINADTLKTLYVSTIVGSCIGWYASEIIERIGCVDYMFPNYVSCIVDLWEGGTLRCYSDNNFPIYETGESSFCDYITSINSFKNPAGFVEVYPNPATTNLIIRNKNGSPTDLKIVLISSLNQKVLEYNFYHEGDFIIDISCLKPGFYFLHITNDKGYCMTEKIVII